jgi:hypothetical protein
MRAIAATDARVAGPFGGVSALVVGCHFFGISGRVKHYSRPIKTKMMRMTTTKPNTPLGP